MIRDGQLMNFLCKCDVILCAGTCIIKHRVQKLNPRRVTNPGQSLVRMRRCVSACLIAHRRGRSRELTRVHVT